MGLVDDIHTLRTRYEAAPTALKGQALAEAIAQLILRKNSKYLIDGFVRELAILMQELGREQELNAAAGGVNILHVGARDKQAAVKVWLGKKESTTPATTMEQASDLVERWMNKYPNWRVPFSARFPLKLSITRALNEAEAAGYTRGLADRWKLEERSHEHADAEEDFRIL